MYEKKLIIWMSLKLGYLSILGKLNISILFMWVLCTYLKGFLKLKKKVFKIIEKVFSIKNKLNSYLGM